jgi:hypothetical protein
MTMAKPILFNAVEYQMLLEISKKSKQKPDQYLKTLIKEAYEKLK